MSSVKKKKKAGGLNPDGLNAAHSTSAPAWILAPDSFKSSLDLTSTGNEVTDVYVPSDASLNDSRVYVVEDTLHAATLKLTEAAAAAGSASAWPQNVLNRSLFLDQSVMRVLRLGRGDWSVVKHLDQEAAYRVWPIDGGGGGGPTDAGKAKKGAPDLAQMTLHAAQSLKVTADAHHAQVSIAKVSAATLPAKYVHVSIRNANGDMHDEGEVSGLLKTLTASHLCDLLIRAGSSVPLNFYGKLLQIHVEKVVPLTASAVSKEGDDSVYDLTEKFRGLITASPLITSTPQKAATKSDDTSEECFNIVTDATKIVFSPIHKPNEHTSVGQNVPVIGGLSKEIKVIGEAVSSYLQQRSYVGILVYGPSGTGKSTLSKVLPSVHNWRSAYLNGAEVFSKFSGETESNLRSIFAKLRQTAAEDDDDDDEPTSKCHRPCMLFIDEFDILCSSSKEKTSDQERRVASTLRSLIDDLSSASAANDSGKRGTQPIVLIAATNRPSAIDSTFRRPGRFDVEVEISVPNVEARTDILQKLLEKECEGVLPSPELVGRVAQAAHGYVGADLQALCGHATSQEGHLSMEEALERALKVTKPSAMREIQVEVPNVSWRDIGGMEELKLKLKQAVEWPIKHAGMFAKMGVSPPKGVLMYGPPGCSKTMIAKALANESKLNFVAIKGPELFSKWVGESEQAVRDLFHRARRVAPSIIFFDEIDALGAERGGGGSGKVGDRVLAQMLTEMDGIEQLGDVTIVAATNRPDMIDKALMRPGRLDRIVYVPLPDTPTRLKILQVHTRNKPLSSSRGGIDLEDLARRTEGYSGAELSAVCNEAAMKALEDLLMTRCSGGDGSEDKEESENQEPCIEKHHFEEALRAVTPRINDELLDVYRKFQSSQK